MSGRGVHMKCEVFEHMKPISRKLFTQRVYEFEVEGRRDRGRPPTRWIDGDEKQCNTRSVDLSNAKVKCRDREQ